MVPNPYIQLTHLVEKKKKKKTAYKWIHTV